MKIEINIDDSELSRLVTEYIAKEVMHDAYVNRLDYNSEVSFSRRQIRDMIVKIMDENKETIKGIVVDEVRSYVNNSATFNNGKLRKMIEDALKG